MSYRTTINDAQIFGNNEHYEEWMEFIKSKGIQIDEEGCYDGELTDFMEIVDVIETIVMNIEKTREERLNANLAIATTDAAKERIRKEFPSLFNLSNLKERANGKESELYKPNLLDEIIEIVKYGYLFLPYQLVKACEDIIEPDPTCLNRARAYRLKKGCTIKVHAA